MHRTLLLSLLEKYAPLDTDEIESIQMTVDFITQNPDCFERTCISGHITASAWILSKDGQQALLTHHAKLNDWFQLGGHCDGESDVLSSARREAQEESGINAIESVHENIFDIDIHLIPENSKDPAHYHYDIRFLLQVASDEMITISDESHALKWITKDRSTLPTSSRSVVRMFDKWLALAQ